ncbi:MAG: flavodoxin domain-containing protein [Anaerolineae bacterium]|nr:flavodoxin domain-containing protein [Anaerolineae bacterium]
MSDKVLIAYASKHGSTAEIAEKIGEVFAQSGLETDVLPVKKVKDLAPYGAVILGSAVYIGMWRKDAVRFVNVNQSALADRKVWIFSSGPTGEGDPVELLKGWRLPKKVEPIVEAIKPRDTAVFHGNVDPDTLSGMEKMMIKQVEAPTGDFRDWGMITAWAEGVAAELKA